MSNKKVSIIMNCYNGQDFLKESLNSVINQTYKNWELIFYDNCSNDRSKDIFFEYKKKNKKFKYFKSKTKEKLGIARFNAFKKITGSFFLFFDCDDYLLPTKIKTQIKFFKKKTGAVYSNSLFFSKFRKRKLYNNDEKNNKKTFYNLIENYDLNWGTVIFNTKHIKKLDHVLDKRFNLIHDFDLLIRLSKISEINYCPFVLSHWRLHSTSSSNNAFNKFAYEKKMFERKITNIYPEDQKLKSSLDIFNQKRLYDELIGYLIINEKLTARKILKKIENKKLKIIFYILLKIPFSKFFTKYIIYFYKTIFLR